MRESGAVRQEAAARITKCGGRDGVAGIYRRERPETRMPSKPAAYRKMQAAQLYLLLLFRGKSPLRRVAHKNSRQVERCCLFCRPARCTVFCVPESIHCVLHVQLVSHTTTNSAAKASPRLSVCS